MIYYDNWIWMRKQVKRGKKMKKFLKLSVLMILILTILVTAVGASAESVAAPARYDAYSEGIVSGYYHIDYEKGYITGVAPGTTAEKLASVCLPAGITASQETLGTGTTITATVTRAIQPEPVPEETTAPTEETTVPIEAVTEPSEDPTVPTEVATEPTEETTAPTEETTEPTEETMAPTEEATEPTEETTVPTEEATEPTEETTAPTEEATEPTEETTAPTEETTEPTEEATAPTEEATEPTEETTEPTAEITEPAEETTAPTEEVTEPAEPETAALSAAPAAGLFARGGSTLETKTYSLTVIVTGDLNGDASVSITDMLMLKSAILGEKLSDTAQAAGDINGDGKVTITDFLKVKSCLLGLETISAGKAPEGESIVLLTPGSSESWHSGAASYLSDDAAVASVSGKGTITAGDREGSTFVYALDKDGNVIDRTIVTVLEEKLTISLGASSYKLIQGESLTLTPSFNHPVDPAVTWKSSDEAVVTVDESGKVTTKGYGTAVVTASLKNGSKAKAKITVAPPITDMEFSQSLYKVKPGKTKTLELEVTPADTGEEILWSSSNTSIATVSEDGVVTGVKYGTVTITAKGRYSGLSTTCKVKVCDVKQVAITFDDGPCKYTTELLDFLEEYDIKVTFFLVGNRINNFANTVKRMAEAGHEIGYHSYAHVIQTTMKPKDIISDYEKSCQILKNVANTEFTAWRSPGGGYSDTVLNCIPLPHIYWSVDTRDWEHRNADKVYYSVKNAKDGSIVLLHDIHYTSIQGAMKALKEMAAGDYEFLTVTELLSRDGTPPEPSKSYSRG